MTTTTTLSVVQFTHWSQTVSYRAEAVYNGDKHVKNPTGSNRSSAQIQIYLKTWISMCELHAKFSCITRNKDWTKKSSCNSSNGVLLNFCIHFGRCSNPAMPQWGQSWKCPVQTQHPTAARQSIRFLKLYFPVLKTLNPSKTPTVFRTCESVIWTVLLLLNMKNRK